MIPSRLAPPRRHLMRSLLYMPANNDRFIDKAHTRGADGIILDLEDSVAVSEKASARRRVAEAAARLRARGVDLVVVRVNAPLRLTIPDLEAVVGPDVDKIILPKCQSASHVRMICGVIAELEAERGMEPGVTGLGARVETAAAFGLLEEIAAADPRITSLGLGAEDFSMSIGVEPAMDTLIYPKQRAVIAARAAGVTALGLVGSGAEFSNPDGVREIVRQSRRFGFQGAGCIHPGLVPILNEGFSPSAAEVDRAARMVKAFDEATASGIASIDFEGNMVDYPVADRARELLARHEATAARAHAAGRA